MRKQILQTELYDSPCGKLVLASLGNDLCMCDWYGMPYAERNKFRLERILKAQFRYGSSEVLEQAKRELQEYFEGRRRKFSVPLLPAGTDFQISVWDALKEIPYGETRTYGEITRRVDNGGTRAVGHTIGSNAICIFIPCHRVVGSDRKLQGYSGGAEAKRFLLNIEGVDM